jgi:DNA-binding CsgD family transcriptional regulator
MTAFDGFDTEGYYDGSLWYSPPGTVPLERVQLLGELVHEHPYFHHLINTPELATTRTSDAVPLKEFHKTTLYNEFYRTFDGEAQMSAAMRLGPKSLITCSLHRPTLDFTDIEHAVWKLVVPHLKAAFKNAQFVAQIDRERRTLGQAAGKGVIVLGEKGQLLFESEIARRRIQKYFDDVQPYGLPAVILDFAASISRMALGEDYFRPTDVLIISDGKDELHLTVTVDSREREVLIFLEERRPQSISDFEKAGVTRREAEILYWIGQGKTDPDIALLLSISPRTVQKHIEHIFTKLGVETRTAAVMRSLDLIRSTEPR